MRIESTQSSAATAEVADRPGNGGEPLLPLSDPLSAVFDDGLVLSPELNEVYELRLAMLEASRLDRAGLVERGAYFVSVDGEPTNHLRICTGGGVELPPDAASRLHSFLGRHRLKSSYATHGLFPYRGKFHPQMIKAILNVIGVGPGDLVLDPMAGSGTTAIEANTIGANAIAVDLSPFCNFMMEAKISGLTADTDSLDVSRHQSLAHSLYAVFRKAATIGHALGNDDALGMLSMPARKIVGLAFMDARGYAQRSARKSEQELFQEVLNKYLRTIRGFQRTWKDLGIELGKSRILQADARNLPLTDSSVDGVVFSPPYSFAIDYVANDLPHLEYLDCDASVLKQQMIGLGDRNKRQRALNYFSDMSLVLRQVARVLKPNRYCTIVVGSNSNQLASALGIPKDSEEARFGIESRLIASAGEHGFVLDLSMSRLIVGMANTMRDEHILFLRKVA